MLWCLLPFTFSTLLDVVASSNITNITNVTEDVLYRPATHFTPSKNFINDPNGLLYDRDAGIYHLYFQYNPNGTVAGNQHWGHATSPDLFHWKEQQIALFPDKNGSLIFSGSMVNDENNTSGLFPRNSTQNFVALYTLYQPTLQTQAIAYSLDGGYTFTQYKGNPVLNINQTQFRDPQVQWYEPDEKWVMTVAVSRDHKVEFYDSKDLIHWNKTGEFRSGLLGVDYECPNLVPVKDDRNQTKWVLFISLNPGMPLGGSGTEYFIGDFNGTSFVPDDSVVNFVDFAKDNYALQYINPGRTTTEEDIADAKYIAWFGNWQYCQETPTGSWRGAMTYARRVSLKHDWLNDLKLHQEPVNLESLRLSPKSKAFTLGNKTRNGPVFALPPNNTAYEILLNSTLAPLPKTPTPGESRLILELYNDNMESIEIGIDPTSGHIWLDRSNVTALQNPFLTDKFSLAIKQPVRNVSVRAVFDASLIEIYADDGFAVASSVYYAEEPLTHARVRMANGGASNNTLTVYPLRKTVDHRTYA